MKRKPSSSVSRSNNNNNNRVIKWYEECGEAFFTQLILGYFDNPTRDLSSLAQTCKFIYQIYSSHHCDHVWKSLLLKHCPDLGNCNVLEDKNSRGKLMSMYYQLLYYENHLDQVPKEFIILDPTLKERTISTSYSDPRPYFMCASSYGYYFAQGFITMLVSSFFSEDYDPCCVDSYRYNLEMDDNSKRMVTMLPVSMNDEYPSLYEEYAKMSDGMIYIIVIQDDFNPSRLNSDFESFQVFYKQVQNMNLLNQYILSLGIHYKGSNIDDSFKKIVEDELRRYVNENFKFKNCVISECSLTNRVEVTKLTVESVKRYRFIDPTLFLPYLLQSNKNNKKCNIM